jgi:hypothetical protein
VTLRPPRDEWDENTDIIEREQLAAREKLTTARTRIEELVRAYNEEHDS